MKIHLHLIRMYVVALSFLGSLLYAQTVTIPFSYTGGGQYFTVPTGVTSITVKAWGAGGGGSAALNDGGSGGSGAFAQATIPVTPGTQMLIVVGGGGLAGTGVKNGGYPAGGQGGQRSGSGGGYSAIFAADAINFANVLVLAGGGGGGAYFSKESYGGAGGGTNAPDVSSGGTYYGGKAGTQGAGGASGHFGNDPRNASAGSAFTGGKGTTSSYTYGGGGGGSGYYGGGGGVGSSDAYKSTGGGGGSSYIRPSATSFSLITGNTGNSGAVVPAPNTTDPSYLSGIGRGGSVSGIGQAAGDGRLVISYAAPYVAQIISANTGSPTWCAGETRNVSVTIKNIGDKPWTDVAGGDDFNIGVKWNTNGTSWNDYNVRVDAQNLAPGQTKTYNFTITASTNIGGVYGAELPAGTNNLTFDVVYEQKFWFGNNNGGGGPGNSVFTTPNQTILRIPKAYTIQQATSPAGANSCTQDYVKLDIAGVPPANAFEERFTPLSHSWTKRTYGTEPIYYGINMNISNSNYAGGLANEVRFYSMSDSYSTIADWSIHPNTGDINNYLPISLDGYTGANLSFKSRFQSRGGSLTRNIYAEISTDTTNWISIWAKPNIGSGTNYREDVTVAIPSTYLGSTIYIRFRYYGAGTGLQNWYLDDIVVSGNLPPVSWSPTTGLYTDAALTIPYTGGDVTSLYAAPNGSQLYTLSASMTPCTKTTTSTIVHNKKKFVASSGNWSVDSNWFPVLPPTSNQCVYIPSGMSSVIPTGINANAKKVTVSGALTINANGSLTVTDAIVNTGAPRGVIVKSDGNLLQINPDPNINSTSIAVRRLHALTTPAANGTRKEYNFLSSPVAGQNMNEIFGGAGNVAFVTKLNEANNSFVNAAAGDYQIKGKGFAVKEPKSYTAEAGLTNNEAEYKGIPNNGNITVDLDWSAPGKGYNVVGNPYPSNVDIIELYANSTQSLIDPTFRFWDNTVNHIYVQMGGSYQGYSYALFNALTDTDGFGTAAPGRGGSGPAGTKVPNRVIKVSQAFMVRALGSGAKLNFSNTQRKTSYTGTVFYGKQSTKDRYRLQLVKDDGFTIQNGIAYFAAGNYGFGREDTRIPNSQASDALFSYADDAKVVINGRAAFNNDDVVTLGLRHFVAGTYKIEAVDLEGVFANGQSIYLKDKVLGILTDLAQGPYSFTSNAGEFTNRFEVVYKPQVILATADSQGNGAVNVYSDAGDFVVKSSAKIIDAVEIYDASGRMILTQDRILNKEFRFSANRLVDGMYVIKVRMTDGEILSKKIRR